MNAWILAAVVVLVALGAIVAARRRAARRAAEAEARARARRRRLPVVSSNLRGRATVSGDLWKDDAAGITASDPAGR
jgi:membrane protein implicated in regulation of membrane protease activity